MPSLQTFLQVAALFILSMGCSGLQQSQQEKIRKLNAQKDVIYRNHDDTNYVVDTPAHRVRESYPWEQSYSGKFTKITKEYFRCKGSSSHPPRAKENDPGQMVYDCGGIQKHSLPVREGKEFVYPILLDLLNYVQAKTGHKVIITCGHRCPEHNTYADGSTYNQSSKHMIGAEVDFFVQGMEESPEKIVELIMDYYKKKPEYKNQKDFELFSRLTTSSINVSTPPWFNKEILIKLYQKTEGRDLDNKHPYPYLSLQVRFDRGSEEKTTYSWEKAFHGYLRY